MKLIPTPFFSNFILKFIALLKIFITIFAIAINIVMTSTIRRKIDFIGVIWKIIITTALGTNEFLNGFAHFNLFFLSLYISIII